jgi:hypothetical protein
MATSNLPVAPNTRKIDFGALVKQADPAFSDPQPAYIFSNGREFKDPGANGGAYDGE